MKHSVQELLDLLETVGPRVHVLLTKLTGRVDAAEDILQELFLKLSQSAIGTRRGDEGLGLDIFAKSYPTRARFPSDAEFTGVATAAYVAYVATAAKRWRIA